MATPKQRILSLQPLVERLGAADAAPFRAALRQSAAVLDELLTEAADFPLAFELLVFLEANLPPLAELPHKERQQAAKRLGKLITQLPTLLKPKAPTQPPRALVTVLKDFPWPQPPEIELPEPAAKKQAAAVAEPAAEDLTGFENLSGLVPEEPASPSEPLADAEDRGCNPLPQEESVAEPATEPAEPLWERLAAATTEPAPATEEIEDEEPPFDAALLDSTPYPAEITAVLTRLAGLVSQCEEPLLEATLPLYQIAEQPGTVAWRDGLANYAALWQPFGLAAEMIGLTPLTELLAHLERRLNDLGRSEPEADVVGEIQAALQVLPGLMMVWLTQGDPASARAAAEDLAQQLHYSIPDPAWADLTLGLSTIPDLLGEGAADALMVLDSGGVEEWIADAIRQARANAAAAGSPMLEESEAEAPADEAFPDEPEPEQSPEEAFPDETLPRVSEPAGGSPEPAEETEKPEEPKLPAVAPFSPDSLQLLEVLANGLKDHRADMERIAAGLPETDAEGWRRSLGIYAEKVGRLMIAAQAIEFAALHEIAGRLVQGLETQKALDDAALRDHWGRRLGRFPDLVLDYLHHPQEPGPVTAFFRFFAENGLLDDLDGEGRDDLLLRLAQGPVSEAEAEEEIRLTAADLALTPDPEADREVLASVAAEGPRLAAELAVALKAVIDGQALRENLRRAQRLVHTLKGSANICGIRGIANLSHHLEELLENLADRDEPPDAGMTQLLVDASDALESALEVVFNGEEHDAAVFAEILRRVVGWAEAVRRGLDEPVEVQVELPAEPAADAAEPTAPARAATLAGPGVAVEMMEALQSQASELAIALTQAESRIAAALELLRALTEQHAKNLGGIEVLEELADIRGLGTRFPGLAGQTQAEGRYDPLELEQYNEFYITTRRLNEGEHDARALVAGLSEAVARLDELNQQQVQLNREIQEIISRARQVPVAGYVTRLQRVVRQTCRSTGKEAELVVSGSELLVDSEVMDALTPALLHLLRNAIDHGIEPAELRRQRGKPESGAIHLGFARVGNFLEVRFGDDGNGLDYAAVRAKAIRNGMITEEARLSDRELAMLTLKPGFTTRETTTQISGRGIGMNVVDAAVRELKGGLSIESEPGKGYSLTLRVPVSTISTYALLVSAGNELFAIPSSEVKLAVPLSLGTLVQEAEGSFFEYNGARLPLHRLDRLLGRPDGQEPPRGAIVLIVYTDVDEQAVLAASLEDSRSVVAKKLGRHAPSIPGIDTATILGDGRIVPILELRTLLRHDLGRLHLDLSWPLESGTRTIPKVLIVDDSLSMRKSLSQLVSDGGFQPLTAGDGLEALRVMERQTPDILLVDMEMPQMNGLELTRHIRTQEGQGAEGKRLPIAMITSRATQSHRERALEAGVDRYFVKPYREDEILEFIETNLQAEPEARGRA